ncbi:MAG TPA: hypothetical protein VGE95_04145 [Arthrobacter sp.]
MDMLIWNEMLPHLSDVLALLKATEVARSPEDEKTTRVTVDMPYVPDGAVLVEPGLQRTPDGVRVQSIVWQFAGPDAEDDPPVQCWHTEPDTPCDWNVCRQPERPVAGDVGTDPAEEA